MKREGFFLEFLFVMTFFQAFVRMPDKAFKGAQL
jgi:hypothetical protein